MPRLFGSSARSTEASYKMNRYINTGSRESKRDEELFSKRSARSDTIDESSSQERIIGITKTVAVQVVAVEKGRNGEPTAETDLFGTGGGRV